MPDAGTLFAADMGDPIDGNIYGNHPVYYETRYFSVDGQTRMLVSSDDVSGNRDRNVTYESYTHAVYLRDAHAHEVLLRNDSLTWRTLGGEIDLYFYSGPTIEAATRAYQLSAAGLPAMQQYWTLGFHQCRWGYRSWAEVAEVVADFKKFDIPLETIWTDIDYMNQYRNFENDAAAFGYAEAAAFLEKLHADEQHYVPIIDAAIYVPNPQNESDAYPTYDRGVAADAFMLNPDGSLYIGAVWPGYTVFPDWIGGVFNGTGAFRWWADELAIWHSRIAFDGAWIDMNEASSFCVGSCGSNNLTLNPVHPPFKLPGEPGAWQLEYPEGFNISNSSDFSSVASWSSSAYAALSTSTGSMPVTTAATSTTMLSSVSASESSPVPASASSTSPSSYLRTVPTPGSRNINYPPYAINNWQGSGDLAVHAVSPNATHHGTQRWQEYDVHNLFGHQMLNATYSALRSLFPAVRPFIIGRSTFVGSGRWAGHWGGDNKSKWSYMFFSIPQALSFSLSGIPIFGVDTCGFSGNTDAELCARWMSLSAFFTFYRNHNILAAIPQEPYRWSSVAAASRNAMAIRYRLLPYMYTLLRNAHTRGDTVMRALAWEFPREPWLAAADRQFLLGPAVLVTPVLVRGATSVNGVFPGVPEEVWYDWYTGSAALSINATRGQNVTIADVPIEKIPVFIRGGYVIPMQEARNTTANCRRSPWSVLVALDRAGTSATGELYLDDGVSVQPEETLSVAVGHIFSTSPVSYMQT